MLIKIPFIKKTWFRWRMKQTKNTTSCRNVCTSTSCASKLHPYLSRTYFEAWRHLSPAYKAKSFSNAAKINKKESKKALHGTGVNTPDHVAIIMDGNGRWARNKGLVRVAGHKEGLTTLVTIVKTAVKCKVKMLTLYAFSTENWKRPRAEVEFILRLPKEFLEIYLPEMIANNVRIHVIGDMENLPHYTREAIDYAINRTRNNDGLQLNIALNYGSRHELMEAMKKMFVDLQNTKLPLDKVDEQYFSKYLYTANMPEPDLLIRTGGEKRLSNFLLWQLAYTEFCFTDVLWPDFSEEDFLLALDQYQQRHRRFGGV